MNTIKNCLGRKDSIKRMKSRKGGKKKRKLENDLFRIKEV